MKNQQQIEKDVFTLIAIANTIPEESLLKYFTKEDVKLLDELMQEYLDKDKIKAVAAELIEEVMLRLTKELDEL